MHIIMISFTYITRKVHKFYRNKLICKILKICWRVNIHIWLPKWNYFEMQDLLPLITISSPIVIRPHEVFCSFVKHTFYISLSFWTSKSIQAYWINVWWAFRRSQKKLYLCLFSFFEAERLNILCWVLKNHMFSYLFIMQKKSNSYFLCFFRLQITTTI